MLPAYRTPEVTRILVPVYLLLGFLAFTSEASQLSFLMDIVTR